MSSAPIRVSVKSIERRIQEVRLRMPFRFGVATLTGAPMMTMRVEIETDSGERAVGYSADILPAQWFDKAPGKTIDQKIDDQIEMSRVAMELYLEHGSEPATPFQLWWDCYPLIKKAAIERGINSLTAGFGSSFPERAVIDAACRAAGVSFFDAATTNLFGIQPHFVHHELAGFELRSAFPERPLAAIGCRHTVGLGDPLRERDVTEKIGDGLPESLESDITSYGLRYFKIKIDADREWNLERLNRIAEVLNERCREKYYVTLDGNEQVKDLEDAAWLLAKLGESERTRALRDSILFIEQPLSRDTALTAEVAPAVQRLGKITPLIIDESDNDVVALPFARDIGYSGISCKNCKGVFKAILNKCLVTRWNKIGERDNEGARPWILSSEDLTNTGVIPLQQDCTTIAALGFDHSERNGHHYFKGLDHLSEKERRGALVSHEDLYEWNHGSVVVRIRGGMIAIGSLLCKGYGYDGPIDFESRLTLEDWAKERVFAGV
jgi:hypothetical protein